MAESDLSRAALRSWDQNAHFWDDKMGEGNAFHLTLVRPGVERLLGGAEGQRVLDVGCGNGLLARRLAALGAEVVAVDGSAAMLQRAAVRGDGEGAISYRVMDATSEAELLNLGVETFDAAVAAMVLMDLPVIGPLASALSRLLKPGGRFVFAVAHPCFNTTGTSRFMEATERDGRSSTIHGVKITTYRTLAPAPGVAIVGQPVPHTYFDRSLTALLAPFFNVGLRLDGLEEPVLPPAPDGTRPDLWDAHREIPPVLLARLRRAE